jgi:hypothetical protein
MVPQARRAHPIEQAKIDRLRELALRTGDSFHRNAKDFGRGMAVHVNPGLKGREHRPIGRDHGGQP